MAAVAQIQIIVDEAQADAQLAAVKAKLATIGDPGAQSVAALNTHLKNMGTTGALAFGGLETESRKALVSSQLFREEMGVHLPRAFASVIAHSQTLGPLMASMFSVAVGLTAVTVLTAVAEKIHTAMQEAMGFTKALKDVEQAAIAASNAAMAGPTTPGAAAAALGDTRAIVLDLEKKRQILKGYSEETKAVGIADQMRRAAEIGQILEDHENLDRELENAKKRALELERTTQTSGVQAIENSFREKKRLAELEVQVASARGDELTRIEKQTKVKLIGLDEEETIARVKAAAHEAANTRDWTKERTDTIKAGAAEQLAVHQKFAEEVTKLSNEVRLIGMADLEAIAERARQAKAEIATRVATKGLPAPVAAALTGLEDEKAKQKTIEAELAFQKVLREKQMLINLIGADELRAFDLRAAHAKADLEASTREVEEQKKKLRPLLDQEIAVQRLELVTKQKDEATLRGLEAAAAAAHGVRQVELELAAAKEKILQEGLRTGLLNLDEIVAAEKRAASKKVEIRRTTEEETLQMEETAAAAILPPWARANADIIKGAEDRVRAIQQKLRTSVIPDEALAARQIAAVWTEAGAKMRDTLAGELESLFNDISTGNVGKRIMDNVKKLFAGIAANWLITIGGMKDSALGGFLGDILGVHLPGAKSLFGGGAPGLGDAATTLNTTATTANTAAIFGLTAAMTTAGIGGAGGGGGIGGLFSALFGAAPGVAGGPGLAIPPGVSGALGGGTPAAMARAVSPGAGLSGWAATQAQIAGYPPGASILPGDVGYVGQATSILGKIKQSVDNAFGDSVQEFLKKKINLPGGGSITMGGLFGAIGAPLLAAGIGRGGAGGAILGGLGGALEGLSLGGPLGGLFGFIAGLAGGLFGGKEDAIAKARKDLADLKLKDEQLVKDFMERRTDIHSVLSQLEQGMDQKRKLLRASGAGFSALGALSMPHALDVIKLMQIELARRDRAALIEASPLLKIPEFAGGGFTGGDDGGWGKDWIRGGGRGILAMLHPNEAVLNPWGRARLGDANISALNQGAPSSVTSYGPSTVHVGGIVIQGANKSPQQIAKEVVIEINRWRGDSGLPPIV